jgi:hypothetical protein
MDIKDFENIKYTSHTLGIPHPPKGIPTKWKTPRAIKCAIQRQFVEPPAQSMPGSNLPRALNYLADYSGCGLWRLGAAEHLLNFNNRMIVNSLTTMVLDPRFYMSGLCAIKLQRQATPVQKEFVKFLKEWGGKLEAKIIYEIDDIVFHEDIPMFNGCRKAFTDPEIRKSISDIMENCDEILVASEYMRDYYKTKTNNKKVVYIPNYAPKYWFDRYYNETTIMEEYTKNKKRPRILVTGSGTHYDVTGQNGLVDDYSHVVQAIIDTRKDFEWVFLGGHPVQLRPFIANGDIKFIKWSPLMEFANTINNVHAQVTMAALANNHFNRAKSWIKFTESGHLGIPFVGQKLEPYKDSFHQFVTSDEMIDQIKSVVSDETKYLDNCRKHRNYTDNYWLDDHLDEHIAIYTTKYGDPKRKIDAPYLARNNPEQFSL